MAEKGTDGTQHWMGNTGGGWWLLAAFVILIAFLLRAVHLDFGLPQRLHPDEWSQVEVAWRIANGDPNPHFFRYPSAFMYLLAVVFRTQFGLASEVDLPQLYWTGRILSAVMGTLTVGLAVMWGRVLWGRWWGLLSGVLLALLYTAVEQSHYATVDGPMVFWSTAALWLMSGSILRRSYHHLVVAAVIVGIGMATKYNAGLLLVPLMLTTWSMTEVTSALDQRARRRWMVALVGVGLILVGASLFLSWREPELLQQIATLTSDGQIEPEYLGFLAGARGGLQVTGLFSLALSVGLWLWPDMVFWCRLLRFEWLRLLLLVGLTFVCLSPFLLLEWRLATRDFFYEMRHMQIGAAAHISIDDPNYSQILAQSSGFLPSLPANLAHMWREAGWVAMGSALIGACWLGIRWSAVAIPLLAYGLLLFLAVSSWGNWATRYLLPLYPLFCLLVVGGLVAIRDGLRKLNISPLLQTGIVTCLALAVFVTPVRYTWAALAQFALPDTRELAHIWLVEEVPAGAKLARDPYALDSLPVQERYVFFDASPYVLSEWDVADLIDLDIDYVLTTQTLGGSGAPEETSSEFFSAYAEAAVIPADAQARGRTIFIYRRKP